MLGVGRGGPLGASDRPGSPMSLWASAASAGALDVASRVSAGVDQASPLADPGDRSRRDAPSRGRPRIEERHALAVLTTVDGLGPATIAGLIAHYGSAAALLEAVSLPGGVAELAALDDGLDRGVRLTRELARGIAEAADRVAATTAAIEAAGVELVTVDDDGYPARLRAIALPPHVLFVEGSVGSLAADRTVAVVGTRRASESGRLTAARIGAAIARAGAVVVSGLATGIDGAAQAAVVAESGLTVGVLGGGHAHFYPRAHRPLADRIVAAGGAIVSEFAPGVEPSRGTFPQRNRIISGLADATVVVEAGARSGALLTANWALDQGRDVFLVPGSIDSPTAAGCLRYLRDYHDTRIVTGVPQLLEDLGLIDTAWKQKTGASEASLAAVLVELGATARLIASELLAGYRTADELVATTGLPIATVLTGLTLLETRGLVAGVYGRYRPIGPLASNGRTGRRTPVRR